VTETLERVGLGRDAWWAARGAGCGFAIDTAGICIGIAGAEGRATRESTPVPW